MTMSVPTTPIAAGGLSAFVADVAERAIKTFAQNLTLFLVAGVSVVSVAWSTALQSAALATLATVLIALVDSRLSSPNPYVEALIRAGRTFVATVVGAIPAVIDAEHAVTFASINWTAVAGFAGTAALLSLLTSLASLPVGPKGSPSLVGAPVIDGEVVAVRDDTVG
ncbi:holin [Gordonia phage Clown]|uniref:Holin n=1 Tax=Gordonia phage Clown TaxID=2759393 RepID=A0A7L7SQ01_9CAUD|nr:holin [Gordonia phage Clown]QOC56044.1 holin [Gordonia phage Clown]